MARARGRLLRSVAAGLALGCLSVSLSVPAAEAADTVAFSIIDPRITQSSGLAHDTRSSLFWTVNDVGSQGTVFAVAPDGSVRGLLGYRARPVDVEAVAMHRNRLYVGDIGDPAGRRTMISVYFFDRPEPANLTVPYRSYDFRYPDGSHDAHTLLVNSAGRLFVVTKGRGAGVYAAPRSPSRRGVNALERVGDAPDFVTDGAFLPAAGGSGERIALRTYVSVEVLEAASYRVVARAATPWQRQGESLAVTKNGRSLLLGSKGKNQKVLRVAVPTKVGKVPAAAGKAPASPVPTPTATASAAGSDTQDDPVDDPNAGSGSFGGTGTVLALVLAGLLALVAGVVAGAAGRRR